QRIKPDCVLWFELAPLSVRKFLEHLQRIVVLSSEIAFDHLLGDAHRRADAKIGRFDDSAQCTLGCNGISADIIPMCRQHTTKVLRPGTVNRTVKNHFADVVSSKVLWFWRKA